MTQEPTREERDTIGYYERNADAFAEATMGIDMSALYDAFLERVRPGGRILDAGCGPGRDALAFMERGYQVVAIDASAAMVSLAAEAGVTARLGRLQDVTSVRAFDGVWASASLLHVPTDELPPAIARLARALRPGGVLYVSFKRGPGARWADERLFVDMTEDSLRRLLDPVPDLTVLRIWQTDDATRDEVQWVNALATLGSRT